MSRVEVARWKNRREGECDGKQKQKQKQEQKQEQEQEQEQATAIDQSLRPSGFTTAFGRAVLELWWVLVPGLKPGPISEATANANAKARARTRAKARTRA
jgi:hypothetical protein